MTDTAVTVFFSYSHKDEALRDELAKHLRILERQKVIASWHDRRISPGKEWDKQINDNRDTAQIILLLISSDFLDSDYCWDIEITRAMERHERGDACVIPVILREVDWEGAPFGKLQALPKNAKAVTTWSTIDSAFKDVTKGIRKAVKDLQQLSSISVSQKPETSTPKKTSPVITILGEIAQKQEQYRQEVRHYLQTGGGELSVFRRSLLQKLRTNLSLTETEADSIEQELQQPYESYKQAFAEALQHENPPWEAICRDLKRFQEQLGLSDSDVQAIERAVDDLRSEKGIDYTNLRDLLKAGKWKDADQETHTVMKKALEGNWSRETLMKFPCLDLLTIDRLWVKYSGGKFGFSVQKQIYVECGGKLDSLHSGREVTDAFWDQVGWCVNRRWLASYNELIFSLSARKGHLPFEYFCGEEGTKGMGCLLKWFSSLASRLVECTL